MTDYSPQIESVKAQEEACILPRFDSDVAWELGIIIRTHCQKLTRRAVIHIVHANSSQPLFFATSRSGTSPDDMHCAKRKEAVVLRWGASSYRMRLQLNQWWQRVGLGMPDAVKMRYEVADPSAYAFHAGGFPVRVKNVEGIVGVIVVVSGLDEETHWCTPRGYQADDHNVIVDGIKEYLAREQSKSEGAPQRTESMTRTRDESNVQ